MKTTLSELGLTPRECDLVRGIVAGRKNRELAHELGLSEQGVKNVLSIIYQKCGVRNRLELALYAVRYGLVAE
jgi:DNA-binding NarL/FixJ family response regulator